MYREAEVRRGVALLDERSPGWRDKFNPGTLEMAGCDSCVLGQVFGDYGIGKWILCGDDVNVSVAHGFSLYDLVNHYAVPYGAYDQLNATWKYMVAETAQPAAEVRELVLV